MSEASTPQPTRTRRWIKVLLVLSLALNVLFVALIGGAMSGKSHWKTARGAGPQGGDPVSRAFAPEVRRALNAEVVARGQPTREGERKAMRAHMQALLTELRKETFDVAAVESLLAQNAARSQARRQRGEAVYLEHIAGMDVAARRALADRIEKHIKRRGPPRGEGSGR